MMKRLVTGPSDLLRAAGISAAPTVGTRSQPQPLAPWRLNLLRAGYGLLALGLGSMIWPQIVDPAASWSHSRSVAVCMLGALSALSLLGLRHPLAMLPLLFFEIAWKVLWLARVALPLAMDDRLDATTVETMVECVMAGACVIVMPWSHVVDRYVRTPGDPWRRRTVRPVRP